MDVNRLAEKRVQLDNDLLHVDVPPSGTSIVKVGKSEEEVGFVRAGENADIIDEIKKRLPQINPGRLPTTAPVGKLLWEQHDAQNLSSSELDTRNPRDRETFDMIKKLCSDSWPE